MLIKRSFLVFIVLFGIYNIILYLLKPDVQFGQSGGQNNIIHAQDYIYKSNSAKIVIVGSSLAARIKNEYLPTDFYNLSLEGGSAYTGLEIIKRMGLHPDMIAIETNLILRPQDNSFTENLLKPGLSEMRSIFPAMQEKYQPVNLSLIKLGQLLLKQKTSTSPQLSKESYAKMMSMHQRDYEKEQNPDTSEIMMHKLKSYIDYFNSKKIRIILFSMPVECELEKLMLPQYISRQLSFTFPVKLRKEIFEISESGCEKYQYNDGEHLSGSSALDYAKYFIAKSDSIRHLQPKGLSL